MLTNHGKSESLLHVWRVELDASDSPHKTIVVLRLLSTVSRGHELQSAAVIKVQVWPHPNFA